MSTIQTQTESNTHIQSNQLPAWYLFSVRSLIDRISCSSEEVHSKSVEFFNTHGRGVFRLSYKQCSKLQKMKQAKLEYTSGEHLKKYGSAEAIKLSDEYNPNTQFVLFFVCKAENGTEKWYTSSHLVNRDEFKLLPPLWIESIIQTVEPLEYCFIQLKLPVQSNPKKCKFCEQEFSDLKRCSRCKAVFYCGKHCQKSDWVAHQHVCSK